MTKEEALIKVKENLWFLKGHPEWNRDKEVVLAAVQRSGGVLQFVSDKLKNDKDVVIKAVRQDSYALEFASSELKSDREVVLAAVQEWGEVLKFATDELRKDKTFILQATQTNKYACNYSLLDGYRYFNEIVEKEGEGFLLSCWNNCNSDVRLQVANHTSFLPTVEQIEIGLKDKDVEVQQIYQLRQDEWLAKIEENKLRNSI